MNNYTLTNMLYYADHRPHPVANIDFTQSDLVKLIVGPTKTEFTVHKAILCERSPFFKACLQGNWLESHTKEVNLTEEHPDMIAIMIKWFYTNNLDPTFLPDATSRDITLLYQTADRYLLFEFKNHIIDKFRAFCRVERRIIEPDLLTALHEQGMMDTMLYAYGVDSLADQIRCSEADYSPGGCYHEELEAAYRNNEEVKVAVEATIARDLVSPGENLCKSFGCQYHEHAGGGACMLVAYHALV